MFALPCDHSVQFSSVTQSCPTLCDPMNHSAPGLPVHHQLPEFTQTHVHRVMPSSHLILCRPLLLLPQSFPVSESFPVSQLFAWDSQSIGVSDHSLSLFLTFTEVRRYYLRKQKLQIRGQEILAESQGNLTQTWIKGQILGQGEISYFFH